MLPLSSYSMVKLCDAEPGDLLLFNYSKDKLLRLMCGTSEEKYYVSLDPANFDYCQLRGFGRDETRHIKFDQWKIGICDKRIESPTSNGASVGSIGIGDGGSGIICKSDLDPIYIQTDGSIIYEPAKIYGMVGFPRWSIFLKNMDDEWEETFKFGEAAG